MINTEIFNYKHTNNYTAFDEILNMVNEFIKDNGIKKEDILEYNTKNDYNKQTEEYRIVVTISYWVN